MKNRLENKDRLIPLPSKEELERVLLYDPKSGSLFWKSRDRGDFTSDRQWKVWNKRYAGKEALNSKHLTGYLCGRIFGILVKSHRVIWKMMTGKDAEIIDHINGDKVDNSWENLRDVDDIENLKNKKQYANNKSGFTGVCWAKSNNKWHAYIRYEGVRINLGFFDNLEDARKARGEADFQYGYHANHGRKETS